MKFRKWLLIALFVVLAGLMVPRGVSAAAKYKKKWVQTNSQWTYYDKKGKLAKGIVKIGSKYEYYFDGNGIQRTGWRLLSGSYYYFNPKTKKSAYMVKSATVDGIQLGKDGKAVITGDACLRKLKLMVQVQKFLEAHTVATQSMPRKKRVMFEYMHYHMTLSVTPDYTSAYSNYVVPYAQWMLDKGYGDCYAWAALYAYILNAIGYQDPLFEDSGGHAWVELKGLFYDVNWSMVDGIEKEYAVPASLSGVNGRPDWASNRYHVFSINAKP